MVKVTDIVVHEFSFRDAHERWKSGKPLPKYNEKSHYGAELAKQERALRTVFAMLDEEFLKEMKVQSVEERLPRNVQFKVEFVLSEANTSLANAIRRALVDEVEVWSLTCDEFSSFKEHDKYMLSDFFRKQVELIPISQDLVEADVPQWEIFIDLVNPTEDTLPVLSGHIQVRDRKTKELVDTLGLWEQHIHLAYLQSGKKLKVNNIQIVRGQGKVDAAAFNHLANVLYDVLDAGPALTSMPTRFLLGYDTHKNYREAKAPIRRAVQYLVGRLEHIKGVLPKALKDAVFLSETLKVERHAEYLYVIIQADTWTLSSLIARYMLDLVPDIPYVAADIEHPDRDTSVIKVAHVDALKIMHDAMEKAIKDLNVVLAAFA